MAIARAIIAFRTIDPPFSSTVLGRTSSRNLEDTGAQTSSYLDLRPRPRLRDALEPVVLDEEGVLRLAPSTQARVPRHRVTGLDPLRVPAALLLNRGDLELALLI